MEDHRFCIFFYGDILGYRDLLRNKTLAQIETALRESLSDVQRIVALRQNHIEGRKATLAMEPEEIAKVFRWAGEGVFSYYFAFDTLLTFLRDLSADGLGMKLPDFMVFCSAIYLTLLIKYGIRLRGVIGLTSDYVIDQELVVFKEIDAAYTLEKSQNWSGIIIDLADDILRYCEGSGSGATYFDYPVPTKHGFRVYPVLNPLNKETVKFLREASLSLSSAIASLEEESRLHESQPDVKEKLENTMKFLLSCKERYATSIEWENMFEEHSAI